MNTLYTNKSPQVNVNEAKRENTNCFTLIEKCALILQMYDSHRDVRHRDRPEDNSRANRKERTMGLSQCLLSLQSRNKKSVS